MNLKRFSSALFSSFCSRLCVHFSRRGGLRFKQLIAGGLALFLFSCSSTPAMATELYTPDGFAKQIDTYKDLALSASNALRNKSWDNNVSVASSIGSVSNTVDFSGCSVQIELDNIWSSTYVPVSIGGTFSYIVPSGKTLTGFALLLHPTASLPVSGKYKVSFDFASDTSLEYFSVYTWMRWHSKNQQEQTENYSISNYRQSSGDIMGSYTLSLQSNVDTFTLTFLLKDPVPAGGAVGGKYSINFTAISGSTDVSTPGTAPSDTDIQSGIASTTTQIASSVNEVYESIQQLMQHISNQLAALWDQIYNYCHVPTYNKLQEILLSIQNISMGSDLQKIADQISNSTTEQTNDLIANEDARTDDIINNQNSNQQKTETAIEKHGNFIIEGLKSLFIPSDEFFKSWFDDMYNFFHDRLGFLMLPIDILIKFIEMFQSAGSSFSGIPFPEFKWIDGTVIIPAQSVQFEFLSTSWGKDIQTKLYFVGNVIMIGALLALMHRKLEEVLGN